MPPGGDSLLAMPTLRSLALLALLGALIPLAALPAAAQSPGGPSGGPSGGPAGGPPNGWSLGVAVISSPEPYVGADNDVLVVPALSITAGRFSFRGIGAAWTLGEWGEVKAEALIRARLSGFDADDSPFLAGMEDRRKSADLGLELTWERERFGLKLTPAVDVLGRSDGAEVTLEAFVPLRFGPVRVEPRVGVAWASADLTGYYYGVRPDEARPGRPGYQPGSTLNATAGVFVFTPIRGRVLFQGFLSFDRLGKEIEDSPIVSDATAVTAFGAVSYQF